MKRTPFLFLAALGAGVPLAFALSPCDHKHGCKHKQAACSVAQPSVSTPSVLRPSVVSTPVRGVKSCGVVTDVCSPAGVAVAPSITTSVSGPIQIAPLAGGARGARVA